MCSIILYLVKTATPKRMEAYAALIVNAVIGDFLLATADALAMIRFAREKYLNDNSKQYFIVRTKIVIILCEN